MDEIRVIDLCGLQCPSPLVKLNDEIASIPAGCEIEAVADDRAFELDIEAWCDFTGNELISVETSDSNVRARIRKQFS
jgi:TusA-related sulfurtransferase